MITGDLDSAAGTCYLNANIWVGGCVKRTDGAAFISETITTADAAVNTVDLCKAECLKTEIDCNAYEFNPSTSVCKIYNVGP